MHTNKLASGKRTLTHLIHHRSCAALHTQQPPPPPLNSPCQSLQQRSRPPSAAACSLPARALAVGGRRTDPPDTPAEPALGLGCRAAPALLSAETLARVLLLRAVGCRGGVAPAVAPGGCLLLLLLRLPGAAPGAWGLLLQPGAGPLGSARRWGTHPGVGGGQSRGRLAGPAVTGLQGSQDTVDTIPFTHAALHACRVCYLNRA